METIKNILAHAWLKKFAYVVAVLGMVVWVVYRLSVISAENALDVFNPARNVAANGAPITVMVAHHAPGIIQEPVSITDNRAYVSASRAGRLAPGQIVGTGEIVSVSRGLDLNTGMHIVTTRGASDGLQYAQYQEAGLFVPVYALDDGAVFVMRDGFARRTPVTVTRQDSYFALISSGLSEGDVIILSRVNDGDKVQVKE